MLPEGPGNGQPSRGRAPRYILLAIAFIAALGLIIGISVGLRSGKGGSTDRSSAGTNDGGSGNLNVRRPPPPAGLAQTVSGGGTDDAPPCVR